MLKKDFDIKRKINALISFKDIFLCEAAQEFIVFSALKAF
jgi:hypothetical protein